VSGRRVADRYAEALLGVAQGEDRVAAVRDELGELVALLEGIPELGALLRRPDVDPGRKLEALREALGDHIFESFIQNKRIEWDKYRTHVSQYELDAYLSIL